MVAPGFCIGGGALLAIAGAWGVISGDEILAAEANAFQNWGRLLSGVGAIGCGIAGTRVARLACAGLGVVYAALAAAGLAGTSWFLELTDANAASNGVHAFVGLSFLGAGSVTPSETRREDHRTTAGGRAASGGTVFHL